MLVLLDKKDGGQWSETKKGHVMESVDA